jgi:hypothetical protein
MGTGYIFTLNNRLKKLEENLEDQYRLLGAAEDGIKEAQSSIDREQYKISIEKRILPIIREYEEEYFTLVATLSSDCIFEQDDIESALESISCEVSRVNQNLAKYPPELVAILAKIEAKLSEPSVAADAKLKATISLLPPFIGLSYDAQLDTENFCRKYFPTFRKLIRNSKKNLNLI